MKELYLKVLEKFNCKEMLKAHECVAYVTNWGNEDFYSLNYTIFCHEAKYPSDRKCRQIRFKCSDKESGFILNGPNNTVDYLVTKDEAVEIIYLFLSIRRKLQDITRDELLELL